MSNQQGTITSSVVRNYFAIPGIRTNKISTNPQNIISMVCQYYHTSYQKVIIKNRRQPEVLYRQIIQYIMYKMVRNSFREIGEITGGFDHASVLRNVRVIGEQMVIYPQLKKDIEAIKQLLK